MDTLTHAFSGVLLARAWRAPGKGLSPGRRDLACAVGAAFPDVDFALMALAPQVFLNLHRGPTHALPLLPLWAGLLGLVLAWLAGRRGDADWRQQWWPYAQLCALGLLIHIAGDWVTLYGTRLLYPFSSHAFALGISYDVNPWIAAVVAAGVLAGYWRRGVAPARAACLLVVALLAAQGALRQQALAVAAPVDSGLADSGLAREVFALPQPLSPFHWHLLRRDGEGYRSAYLDLLAAAPAKPAPATAWPRRLLAGYRARDDLDWRRHPGPEHLPLARQAWSHPRLAAFRGFAELPALYRIDQDADATCVWFTDLRHALPGLSPPFRQGLCRQVSAPEWRLYRLRYFSENRRQAL